MTKFERLALQVCVGAFAIFSLILYVGRPYNGPEIRPATRCPNGTPEIAAERYRPFPENRILRDEVMYTYTCLEKEAKL